MVKSEVEAKKKGMNNHQPWHVFGARYAQKVVDILRSQRLDKTFFTGKNRPNKRMHARVLGILCRVAFECGTDIEIGRSLPLREPLKCKKRNQLHAAPDIALRHKDYSGIFAVVEYESVDVTKPVFKKKLHYFRHWQCNEQGQALPLLISIITVPDSRYWNESATKADIEKFRDSMRKLTEEPKVECMVGIISHETGLRFFKSFAGKETLLSCKWSG